MWGRCVASNAKPFENTLSRRSFTACACWSIVASGSRRMSIAVTAFGSALAAAGLVVWAVAQTVPRASIARAHAPLSRMYLNFVFMVVPFFVVPVSGQLVVDHFSKAKTCFQSFFMLMTVQPFLMASL